MAAHGRNNEDGGARLSHACDCRRNDLADPIDSATADRQADA